MANYVFAYDPDGTRPTREEMDEHIRRSPWVNNRLLETVWCIGADTALRDVADFVTSILTEDDRYILVDAAAMDFDNLLTPHVSLNAAWQRHA